MIKIYVRVHLDLYIFQYYHNFIADKALLKLLNNAGATAVA